MSSPNSSPPRVKHWTPPSPISSWISPTRYNDPGYVAYDNSPLAAYRSTQSELPALYPDSPSDLSPVSAVRRLVEDFKALEPLPLLLDSPNVSLELDDACAGREHRPQLQVRQMRDVQDLDVLRKELCGTAGDGADEWEDRRFFGCELFLRAPEFGTVDDGGVIRAGYDDSAVEDRLDPSAVSAASSRTDDQPTRF